MPLSSIRMHIKPKGTTQRKEGGSILVKKRPRHPICHK
jgi:hypothetical protein